MIDEHSGIVSARFVDLRLGSEVDYTGVMSTINRYENSEPKNKRLA